MIRPAKDKETVVRLRQLERCWLIIELLAPLRRGATTEDLTHDITSILDVQYCERTISRDLAALEQLGIVERFQPIRHGRVCGVPKFAWRFRDGSVRAAVHHRVAVIRSELRDAG